MDKILCVDDDPNLLFLYRDEILEEKVNHKCLAKIIIKG
jgi:hypothetical protein